MDEVQSYETWMKNVPQAITAEDMWKFYGYRKALFLFDLCWTDCEHLLKHPLGKPIAQQLIRSAGSISANIEEGYGRGYGKDRAYFLKIALGSARESKGWYYRSQRLLSSPTIEQRLNSLGEVIALLVTEINRMQSYQK
ncbi:MAG TPA: four helix bundle protein [Anaerolineae bacterium]|nr:four helix bundle protein [Anaerolineae bacterium]HQK15256.1 four helix bundle protein [Anaerolineae bacterium]